MADVSFFVPTNMANQQTWIGTVTGATSTQITVTDGFNTDFYFGSFSYSGNTVLGTLTGFESFAGTTLTSTAAGLSVNASVAQTYIDNNQIQNLFQIAFPGHDVINGSSGNDVLIGYNGNDVFTGGGGNDVISGGGTNNTAVYSGTAAQYTITNTGSTYTITDSIPGRDGTDTLIDIQHLQFSNGTVALVPNSINDLITELYVGYYNRAPDPSGETYWATQLAGGMSLSAIAQSYSVQTESTALYPFLASPNTSSTAAIDSFIAAIYQNLFGRAPDAAGEAYYVQQLQNGQNTVGGTILAIESGAQANDLLILNNKLAVGDYFDTQLYSLSVQFSSSVALAAFAAVTSSASSIATAEAIVNAYVATAPHASATASQAEVGLVGVSPSHDLAVAA